MKVVEGLDLVDGRNTMSGASLNALVCDSHCTKVMFDEPKDPLFCRILSLSKMWCGTWSAKDLIKGLMEKDPKKRLSAS